MMLDRHDKLMLSNWNKIKILHVRSVSSYVYTMNQIAQEQFKSKVC